MSALAAEVARLVIRGRWVVVLLWLTATGLLGYAAMTGMKVQAGIEQMLDEGAADPSGGDAEASAASELVVLVEGPVWTEGFLARLQKLQADLEELRRGGIAEDDDTDRAFLFDRSLSVLNAPRLASEGDTLEGGRYSALLERGLDVYRDAAQDDPTVVGRLVNRDGTLAAIFLNGPLVADDEVIAARRQLERAAQRHDAERFRVSVAGLPVLKAIVAETLYVDIGRLFLLSVAVSLLVLVVTLRSALALISPVLVIWGTTAWTFGAMALLGVPLTIVGLYLPAFLTVVAIGDAVHVQTVYAKERRAGRDRDGAIATACSATASPILYTTLTTCLGLLALNAASIEAVRHLGTFGAVGVLCALVNTWLLVPATLSFDRRVQAAAESSQRRDLLDALISSVARVSRAGPFGGRTWLGVAAIAAAASAVGISQLRVHHDVLEWLPDDNPLSPAVANLDSQLAGSATMAVQLEWPETEAVSRHETLQRIERVEQRLLDYRDPDTGAALVRDVVSVLDIVRGTWRALSPDSPAGPILPETPEQTRGALEFLELSGSQEFESFVNVDRSLTRLDVRLQWTDARTYGGVIQAVKDTAAEVLGRDVHVRITGPVAKMNRAVNALLTDMMRSFAVSCTGVALALIIFMRDLRLGLIALAPNLLPIAIVLGFIGYAGFPLDVHTMLLSSVLLGIVVDDTIHFLHYFRTRFRETGDIERSLDWSFTHAGRAILATSITLALGFLTSLASSLNHMQRTAVLLAFGIMVALLVDLVITPAFIRYFLARSANASQADPVEHQAAGMEADRGKT